MEGLFYNADDGYLEGIVRGYRSSILTNSAYINLTQCETLEGTIHFVMNKKDDHVQLTSSPLPPSNQ
jgi:V-type H+-transporting ATPase subunit d